MPRPTSRLENEYRGQGYRVIAGLDEAGKGAWAGPVVAAAVILPETVKLPKLNDSKLVSAPRREELFDLITSQAVAWGIGMQEGYLVDEIGLGEVHRMAMRQAVSELRRKVDLLLVDGKHISQLGVKSVCVVKGDQKVRCIAAASILAKVTRDRLMVKMAQEFPQYGFDEHKGYGTKKHQEALARHGACALHRLSFLPIISQWQGDLFQYLSHP